MQFYLPNTLVTLKLLKLLFFKCTPQQSYQHAVINNLVCKTENKTNNNKKVFAEKNDLTGSQPDGSWPGSRIAGHEH